MLLRDVSCDDDDVDLSENNFDIQVGDADAGVQVNSGFYVSAPAGEYSLKFTFNFVVSVQNGPYAIPTQQEESQSYTLNWIVESDPSLGGGHIGGGHIGGGKL